MSYYFMVQTKKGEYIPLDITKSKYFSRMSKSRGMNCSLAEIDMFTMMFDDEQELRSALLEEHILPPEYAYKELSARRLYKGEKIKVEYDFLYQKDIAHIGCPDKIISRIEDKLYENDFRFLTELTNHYFKYRDCSSTLPEVREYTNMSIVLGTRDLRFNKRDKNGDKILARMLKLLIYKYKQNESGNLTYSNKVKYANLHDIIAFTNNYDKKYNKEVKKEVEQISLFQEVIKPKTKTRRKVIPGQIGFTDIIK